MNWTNSALWRNGTLGYFCGRKMRSWLENHILRFQFRNYFLLLQFAMKLFPHTFHETLFFFLTVSLVCKSQRNKCVCGEDTRTFTCFCRMGEDEAGWERGTLGDVLFLMTISVRKLEESYVNMCLLQVWLLDLTNGSWDGVRLWLDCKCFPHEWG